jgi:serine/threonine-protein kinase
VAPDGALLINRLRELPATADLIRFALPQDASPSTPGDPNAATTTAPLLETAAGEINAEVSPDGRFLAFQSNVSGVWKVYVAPYPDPASGRREPVSPGSGIQPLWSRDGRHLYYLTLEGDMMAVPVAAGPRSWPEAAGAPARLFDARGYYRGDEVRVFRTYDVASDGRFLMIRPEAPANAAGPPSMLKVVRHWLVDIADRLP